MALQYFHNKGERRDTFIAFEDGFHGDTFGAMSVSGLASYNGPFTDFLLKVERLPVPTKHNLEAVEKQLNHILENNQCAAFVFEPLVQGAAGMKFHSPQGLDALIAICQEQDVLCIADEIMTGFGKTGKNFACDHLQRQPDIICLSKALTAGMFPLSATTCTQAIFEAFLSDEVHKGFFHAHTYSAHPLGCAVALAALDLLNAPQIQERIDYIAKSHTGFLKGIESHPKILNARSLGVILAIDLKVDSARYGHLRDELYEFFMDRGVNIRPLGNTVYALPPFVITNEQLEQVYQSFRDCLAHF
jgi:adenosylmethionine-8-amino-7-oxononanoate aminotransferase